MSRAEMVKKFYAFMTEREDIRLRRLAGRPRPWTSDDTLASYKFTNVKRFHDRTTQHLYNNYYKGARESGYSDEVILLNCTLARYFGTAEMMDAIGWHTDWDERRVQRVHDIVDDRYSRDKLVFTRAYIIPNCGDALPKHQVVTNIVSAVWAVAKDVTAERLWKKAMYVMTKVRGVGPFMFKEVYLDYVLATNKLPEDWTGWTPMGPGGLRGASRIIYEGEARSVTQDKALRTCIDVYHERKKMWKHEIELDLTDIQFQFCEWDKYMRTIRGEGKPKNTFVPHKD